MSSDASSSVGFRRLPTELVRIICHLIPNRDIKNLRLTYRFMGEKALPRLDRVFVSLSPRDIKVIRAVADHETFRRGVVEIVWDDTALNYHDDRGDISDKNTGMNYLDDRGLPSYKYLRATRTCQSLFRARIATDTERPNVIAKAEKWKNRTFSASPTYEQLLQEQEEALATFADEDAFRYALGRFPNLRKVTVTPAAHGCLFEPLYETPMIRAFPYGFVYPIPRGWPHYEYTNRKVAAKACALDVKDNALNQWRGFRIATRVLANEKHHVYELDLGNNKLRTGINHHIFDKPNEQYDSLCSILERPEFRRLTLSVLPGYMCHGDTESDRNRNANLYRLLAKAPDMEHMALQTGTYQGHPSQYWNTSLFSIFPIEKWSKLKHFGLSGWEVSQDDLISFLGKLPSTLESVELSFLRFGYGKGNYAHFLRDIREKLDWRSRPAHDRVRIRMLFEDGNRNFNQEFRYICLDSEVRDYVYGDGPSPLETNEAGTLCMCIEVGIGVQHDDLDPNYERPYQRSKFSKRICDEIEWPYDEPQI
ncbi:hypothetical protein FSARC_11840 [Fusarium sarcochroum]|uniref:F-box domain-containing protein n=1 Tax=Fusarium sarcochroum TaxID=1208366 RepID=A0A8H4WYH0_9HYPO|nr:hypothetical protein FSARC_11840 [Fusarium sarcochroum]